MKRIAFPIFAAIACPAAACAEIAIDADIPGGNILIEKQEGDTVYLRPDYRDTKGSWFYWYFRTTGGTAGKTITFRFTDGSPMTVRGPALSEDGGVTWKWTEIPAPDYKSFTYTFPADAVETRFSFGIPYTQADLDRFLSGFSGNPSLKKEILCKTKKDRTVERLHLGTPGATPRFRIMVTCRAHACEMMTSYAAEGIIEAFLADDARGRWFRDNTEVLLVPFLDKDGVEDGDQGKNRLPRDHNRDYDGTSIHRETAALREFVPGWSTGKLALTLDLHCPHIRGGTNERIYLVGGGDPAMEQEEDRFSALLEKSITGPLPYRTSNNVPFGTEWNTAKSFTAGMNGSRWAAGLPGVKLATTFELPYANAQGEEVNASSARAFGRDLATAIRSYLESLPEP